MALGIRHSPTAITGGRIVTTSGMAREYKGEFDDNVADSRAWFDAYIAERRSRGVPPEGYPVWILEPLLSTGEVDN